MTWSFNYRVSRRSCTQQRSLSRPAIRNCRSPTFSRRTRRATRTIAVRATSRATPDGPVSTRPARRRLQSAATPRSKAARPATTATPTRVTGAAPCARRRPASPAKAPPASVTRSAVMASGQALKPATTAIRRTATAARQPARSKADCRPMALRVLRRTNVRADSVKTGFAVPPRAQEAARSDRRVVRAYPPRRVRFARRSRAQGAR